MAINPLRFNPLDIPAQIPGALARAPESTWSNIASIGSNIAEAQDRNTMSQILKGAVDPKTGSLDLNKAATAIALSGRDPAKFLTLLEAQQRAKEATSYHQNALDVAREGRTIAKQKVDQDLELANRPTITIKGTGTQYDPFIQITTDPRTGTSTQKVLESGKAPPPPPPRQPVPGSSALPSGGPDLAEAEPAGFPAAMAGGPADPEEAPPYQVAGPMMPPPQQAVPTDVVQAQAQQVAQPAQRPAVQRGRSPEQDAWLDQHYPQYAPTLRAMLDYGRDPYKVGENNKEREYLFKLATDLDPTWSPEEFARRDDARKKADALAETGPKAEQTQLGQERGKIELEAVKDAKAAADLQPLLDDAVKSWEQLVHFKRFGGLQTGTGFLAGSEAARLPQKVLGSTEEKLRQGYERTLASLRAKITSTMNQGQGAVSNYERQMYNQIFPEFTTANPLGDLATLKQLQAKGRQVSGVGRETGLGKSTPGFLADRPAVERPSVDKTYQFDKDTAESYRGRSDVALARAQQLIKDGADPAKVRDALRQIDPKLADKF